MFDHILDRSLASHQDDRFVLRLYVVGNTPRSSRAIMNLKMICETHLKGRYDLIVLDLYEQPGHALEDQIVVAPTLIRRTPRPVRRMTGDLSQTNRVLEVLGLSSTGHLL
jgi:circadian clock protein KaiB